MHRRRWWDSDESYRESRLQSRKFIFTRPEGNAEADFLVSRKALAAGFLVKTYHFETRG